MHPSSNIPKFAVGYEGFEGIISENISESKPHWTTKNRPGAQRPNVILIVVDDLGYSDIEPFGGEIQTPHLKDLAQSGYTLTNYHTNPVCSPARASLLTGLNAHKAGFSTVAHADPGFPNTTLEISERVPTIAESFKESGYATFAVGKWHLAKESELHEGADKSSWPLQRGFDRYFGSLDGFTQMFYPHRVNIDNSPVFPEFDDETYFTDVLTDKALEFISELRSGEQKKPFFLYFAHTAVHAPLQAKREDIEKYRGIYDQGWNVVREKRFARQQELGIFDDHTCLPQVFDDGEKLRDWDQLTEEQKALFAQYMEVYAGSVDNVDQNLGRIVELLRNLGELDNTIIAFTSDNGASGEGGEDGTRSYLSQFVDEPFVPGEWERDVVTSLDDSYLGGPRSSIHYPRGWAHVSTTPFKYFKGHTYNGGIRAPLILSWPKGLPKSDGDSGLRPSYSFVTDLGVTLLDLAGVRHLSERNGQESPQLDGHAFSEKLLASPALHVEHCNSDVLQYWEYQGNRALIQDRYKIVTEKEPGQHWSQAPWKLFDVVLDPAETHDLSAELPDLVSSLSEKWTEQAWKNTVFPINDDGSMWFRRPESELELLEPVVIQPSTPPMERYRSSRLIYMRSFSISAELHEGDGVIISHGDQGGGYLIEATGNKLSVVYSEYGRLNKASIQRPLPGKSFCIDFELCDDFTIAVRGTTEESSSVLMTGLMPLIGMSPFTGISVWKDWGGPVDWDIHTALGAYEFSGKKTPILFEPGPRSEKALEKYFSVNGEEIRDFH